jgi:glutathione S-transferase
MLLVEEKRIPMQISLVPMRSYGDKPAEFMRKVPSGLLPALQIQTSDGRSRVITESQVIMELLDQWYNTEDGYKPMMPAEDNQAANQRYQQLTRLERELFGAWCSLVFRPDGGSNPLGKLMGGAAAGMSGSLQTFLACITKVDQELGKTQGTWFFGDNDYPTMIDFIYVSHVERMLASCAYWKGLDLRDPKWKLTNLNAWLVAFEQRESYLAFKSDYYTHVMDIPPQYGPGYNGGFEKERQQMADMITGQDGSWHLPLSFDDPLQPLYKGLPLPVCVLEAAGLVSDDNGSYESCNPQVMAAACRTMAAWKLAGNGANVAKFAARGSSKGSKNPRKTFAGPLADPYAESDMEVEPLVDGALRIVCEALLGSDDNLEGLGPQLRAAVTVATAPDVVSSLVYLRDRIGVPRDLPLASARYLRAYLNCAVDILSS